MWTAVTGVYTTSKGVGISLY